MGNFMVIEHLRHAPSYLELLLRDHVSPYDGLLFRESHILHDIGSQIHLFRSPNQKPSVIIYEEAKE